MSVPKDASEMRPDMEWERQVQYLEDKALALLERLKTREADLAAAAGELRVPAPNPGTDMARMLEANVLMRRERDDALAEVQAEAQEHENTRAALRDAQGECDAAEHYRDAARAQLRVCVSALQDEADMLEQWLQQSAPGPDVVQRRAQILRRIADVARKALP